MDQAADIQGKITNQSPKGKPVIVLMYELQPNGKKLVAYSIYHKPDVYRFMRLSGRYLIAAFEDANEDLVYQKSEYAGYYGAPSVVKVEPEKHLTNLDITLQHPDHTSLSESPDLSSPASKADLGLAKTRFGEVVDVEDGRFSQKNGRLGLWEPLRFLKEVGGGLYFLEPFAEAKTPVVFVHGAGGYPREWTYFINNHLDRTRYQPWIFHYPSGLRLELAAELMRRSLSKIYLKYKFENIIVIAHSMGGLVSRALINATVQKDENHEVQLLFITISTPWGGHQAAQIGVKYAPAVIPSWLDMVPSSPFLQKLLKTPLPDNIHYYLLFGFKGGRNPFTNGNDDGTVSLLSQLRKEAQEAAIKTFGFNENHTSILRSPEVAEKINELINQYLKNYRANKAKDL